jgi:uncharacterized phiE125 gp8 family phage protein
MSLPTLADAKTYLRIQTTAEDAAVTGLLARALAIVETSIGVRLVAAIETVTDWTTDAVRAWSAPTRLQLPRYPVALTPAPVVVDTNGTTVDAATYVVDGRIGQIRAKPGTVFNNGPYAITATIGWSTHPDYATRLEALAAAAILDVVADLYQRRNPGAVAEYEGGAGATYGSAALPARTWALLAPLRIGVGA